MKAMKTTPKGFLSLPLILFFAFALAPDAGAFQLGNLQITPGVELEGIYDDNALLRSEDDPEGEEEDLIGRIRPSLLLTYVRGATDFSLLYTNGFLFHKEFPERDVRGTHHGLTMRASHPLSQRTSIALGDRLQIGTTVSEIPEAGLDDVTEVTLLPRGRDYVRNRVSVDATHVLSRRFQLAGGMGYEYEQYDAIREGGVEEEPETQENHWDVGTTGSYAWHPRNSVSASFGFAYHDYDERGNSRVYTVAVGDAWQITSFLALSGRVGLEYLEEEQEVAGDTTTRDSVHPYGELGATYEWERLTVTALFFYGLEGSSGLGTTVTSKSIRVGAEYAATEDLLFRAFGYYGRSDSAEEAEGVEDLGVESFQAGCGVRYRFLPWVAGRLEYTHIDQDAGEAVGASYNVNRVIVGLSLTLPERIP